MPAILVFPDVASPSGKNSPEVRPFSHKYGLQNNLFGLEAGFEEAGHFDKSRNKRERMKRWGLAHLLEPQ